MDLSCSSLDWAADSPPPRPSPPPRRSPSHHQWRFFIILDIAIVLHISSHQRFFRETPPKAWFQATFAFLNDWPSWSNISICAHILVTSGSRGVAALIVFPSHPFLSRGQNFFIEEWQESEVVGRHLVFVSIKVGMSRNFDCDQELGMKYQESESFQHDMTWHSYITGTQGVQCLRNMTDAIFGENYFWQKNQKFWSISRWQTQIRPILSKNAVLSKIRIWAGGQPWTSIQEKIKSKTKMYKK